MDPQAKKPQPKVANNDRLIEQLRDIGRGVGKTVKRDLVGGVASDALTSLFGSPKSGDMQPGESIKFGAPAQPETPYPYSRMPRREIRPQFSQEALNRLRSQETLVAQKIEEIRQELKALIATLKMVDKQIAQAVDIELVDPGLYHLAFLDRLKSILKLMRQNLNNSSSWLSLMRSRKKEKRYWSLYKKKGTEFGLNSERVVATQVG